MTKHISAEDLLVERVLSLFAPPPRLSLSDWAAQNFRLAERASAEPGRFKPWPYQRFILDAIGDPAVERVTVLKAARVGFTKCLMAAIGASAATQPASIILLVPTDDDARGFAVDEVEPAFQESPALAGLLRAGRNDGRNTMVMKAFAGGGSPSHTDISCGTARRSACCAGGNRTRLGAQPCRSSIRTG